MNDTRAALLHPHQLYGRHQLLGRTSIAPAQAGIYAWYFRKSPSPQIDLEKCWRLADKWLLYVGISPSRASSNANIRKRVRLHMNGNASSSTLRKSLGCLLANQLGTELRRVGSGKQMTFANKESVLSAWLAQNAFVTWVVQPEPWLVEHDIIRSLYLPLNIEGNQAHPFYPVLRAARKDAMNRARRLPVL